MKQVAVLIGESKCRWLFLDVYERDMRCKR
jgi:hypothetical protein